MEELQTRHRKEQRDLQSQITQKKKQASKKTRKAVNDECGRLEAELSTRQRNELAALTGGPPPSGASPDDELSSEQLNKLTLQVDADGDDRDNSDDATAAAAANGHDDVATDPTNSHEPSTTAAAAPRKPNRQKARLARRAAEQASLAEAAADEARALPDHKAQERVRMLEAMSARSLREVEVRADGHCLYSAFADQLTALDIPLGAPSTSDPAAPASGAGGEGVAEGEGEGKGGAGGKPPAYRAVRGTAAGYMASHGDDFAPFLEEPLGDYVRKVRDTGEWGGQLELLALAASYGVVVNVLQDFGRVERIESPGQGGTGSGDGEGKKEIWLGYYKHGFGLGEHYNSLRRVGS